MQSIWQDVRFAFGNLRRSPGFTAAAMITLTVGIAAVSSVFTLVNAVLLQPLPYPEADTIVFLRGELRSDTPREYPLSYLDLQDAARTDGLFAGLSPISGARPFNLAFGADVEHVNGEMVTDDFFRVFALPPAHGRTFTPAESHTPGAGAVVVLAHDFWTRRFGGDPGVIGRSVSLNERTFHVIGVAAAGFRGVTGTADLWLPIAMAHPVYGPHYTEMRQFRWLSGIARLRPGVTVEQAREALDIWARGMSVEHPQVYKDLFLTVVPLQDALFDDTRGPLFALLGASAFVLLIGCVNVANLLLARGVAREREVAVRRALGASRGRVLRQFITESLVLALPACAAGILLARSLTHSLAALWSADLESFVTVALDLRVVSVTVLVSMLAAIGFGIVPAVSASRLAPQRGLGEGSRGATVSKARRRFQASLVVAEVALALTLLAGAALMTKGFSRFISANLGFEAGSLLTLRLDLTADQYKDNDRFWSTARSALDAAAAVPGVTAAALEGPGLPTGGYFGVSFRKHGAADDAPVVSALKHHVSAGYMQTLGIPLLAGREFDESDRPGSPRALVVSEALARRTWPGENPIGQRLTSIGPEPQTWTVVGMVGNVKHEGRSSEVVRDPDIYLSVFQSPARSPSHLTVLTRTTQPAAALTPVLREAIARAAPGVPPYDVRTMQDRLDEQTVRDRFAVRLMAGFAGVALVLAVVGVYGVISYTVTMRTREIGIRAALGATKVQAVSMVLRQAIGPVMAGIAGGLLCITLLQRFVANLLYDVSASDPGILAGTSMLLLLVGVAAAVVPAWRAAMIEPVIALKTD